MTNSNSTLSEVSELMSSVSNNKKLRIFIGYTATFNKFIIVALVLCAIFLRKHPTTMSCDPTSSYNSQATTDRCKESYIFYSFGEQLTETAKTPMTFAEPEHLKQKKVVVFEGYHEVIFFIVAVIFYLPKFLWKTTGGRYIAENLLAHVATLSKMDIDNMRADGKVAEYLKNGLKSLRKKNYHLFLYFICQALMVLTMYTPFLVHYFHFSDIQMQDGFKNVLDIKVEYREDALYQYFPTKVACFFSRYGYSGTIEVINTVCTVSNNNFMQMAVVVMYYFSTVCAVICSFDFVIQILSLCFQPGSDFKGKVLGFYLSMIRMNYPVVITEDLMYSQDFFKNIKDDQADQADPNKNTIL